MFAESHKYDANGLVCGVFQDYKTGEVLTVAWLNRSRLLARYASWGEAMRVIATE